MTELERERFIRQSQLTKEAVLFHAKAYLSGDMMKIDATNLEEHAKRLADYAELLRQCDAEIISMSMVTTVKEVRGYKCNIL